MVTMPLHKLEFLPNFFWYGKPYQTTAIAEGLEKWLSVAQSDYYGTIRNPSSNFSWNPSTLIKLGWFPAYSEPQDLPGAKSGLLWLEGNKPG